MIRTVLGFALLLSTLSCGSSRSTDRLVTRPAQATATFPDRGNLQLETPADLPPDLGSRDRVRIEKSGYISFDGKLGQLPRIADGTYECVLVPLDD